MGREGDGEGRAVAGEGEGEGRGEGPVLAKHLAFRPSLQGVEGIMARAQSTTVSTTEGGSRPHAMQHEQLGCEELPAPTWVHNPRLISRATTHKLPPNPMEDAIDTTASQQPDCTSAATEAAQAGEQSWPAPVDISSRLQSGASSWPTQSASAAAAHRTPAC